MPTLFFNCPQCDRPLDGDTTLDGPTIQCPCCDRVVEIPHPRALGRPITVWLAALIPLLTPAACLYGLLEMVPALYAVPVASFLTMVGLIPAVGLMLGRRGGWVAALVLAITALSMGFGGLFLLAPFMAIGLLSPDLVEVGVPLAVSGLALLGLLFLPSIRAWCDR